MTILNFYKQRLQDKGFNDKQVQDLTEHKDLPWLDIANDYLNEYANWKRNVNIHVDSYPEVVLIEMFKEDNS